MRESNLNDPRDQSLSPDGLVGRKLEDVLVSNAQLTGEELPGLGRPRYFDVVLVLDGGMRCVLQGDQLELWPTNAALEPLDAGRFGIDSKVEFRGSTVTGVSSDEEGDLILELDGRTTLQVVTDYGTQVLLVQAR